MGILWLPDYDSCYKADGKESKKQHSFVIDRDNNTVRCLSCACCAKDINTHLLLQTIILTLSTTVHLICVFYGKQTSSNGNRVCC